MRTEIYNSSISIEEIKSKVSKKIKKNISNQSLQQDFFADIVSKNIREIKNEFGEKIIRIDGEIPIDLPISNGDRFLFISYDQSVLSHGLHKYPAKFFPELPRWLIKRYSKVNDLILDPFSGSGTTNVEALLSKRNSIGIDVDPFSRFISKVKVTPINEQEIIQAQEYILQKIINYKPSEVNTKKDIPSFPYRDNWFNKEIIFELAYLRKMISGLKSSDSIIDFYKVCFSSIIRSVSNADDNCTRTVIRKKLNKKVYPDDALKKFTKVILTNTPKMLEFSKQYPQKITAFFPDNMDARNINYKNNYCDLALTSPPYVNALDYPRTHQLESYWLNLVSGSLTPLKRKHVGMECVFSKDYKKLHQIGVKEADKKISKIYKLDPRRAYIAYKYLEDMRLNIQEVYRVLKNGGRYIIVIGNNKIRGELFESWKYLMEISDNAGFEIEKFFGSEIIKHFIKVPREERINTDWVLVLKK